MFALDWEVKKAAGEKMEEIVADMLKVKSSHLVLHIGFGKNGAQDITFTIPNGQKKFEVKYDIASEEHGNIVLEYRKTDSKGYYLKPSGLSITRADYWVHVYPMKGVLRFICAEVPVLRNMYIEFGPDCLYPLTNIWTMKPTCVPLGLCVDSCSLRSKTLSDGNPPTELIRLDVEKHIFPHVWKDIEAMDDKSWNF